MGEGFQKSTRHQGFVTRSSTSDGWLKNFHGLGRGRGPQRDGIRVFRNHQAGYNIARARFESRHLKIDPDDGIRIHDVFEKVADAVPLSTGQFRADLDSVSTKSMAARAEALRVIAAGPAVVGPKRCLVEYFLKYSSSVTRLATTRSAALGSSTTAYQWMNSASHGSWVRAAK